MNLISLRVEALHAKRERVTEATRPLELSRKERLMLCEALRKDLLCAANGLMPENGWHNDDFWIDKFNRSK